MLTTGIKFLHTLLDFKRKTRSNCKANLKNNIWPNLAKVLNMNCMARNLIPCLHITMLNVSYTSTNTSVAMKLGKVLSLPSLL